MASITAISRCAGGDHVTLTFNTSAGAKTRTYLLSDVALPAVLSDEDYQKSRISLLIREAQAAGNITYAQIRTYLLNREFVE